MTRSAVKRIKNYLTAPSGSISCNPSNNFKWYLDATERLNSYVGSAEESLIDGRLRNMRRQFELIFSGLKELRTRTAIMPRHYHDMSLVFAADILEEVGIIQEAASLGSGGRAA